MFQIDTRKIGTEFQPFIVAELSANHNGSISRAKESIRIAKNCGVDAVKIQSYNADSMTIDSDKEDFIIKEGLWQGYKLYDLYDEAHTPYEWHKELFDFAKDIGITIFSTPFDESAADLLESLDAPAYKIASFELTDLPLIAHVARKKKPLLMSTGMANEQEISEALETARVNGCDSILLFHCISSYPAPANQANLRQIINLKEKFNVLVGLSDHTIGNLCSLGAISLGACAIEKHFTISRSDKGPDSEFSIEPKELTSLVEEAKILWEALGIKSFKRPRVEKNSFAFRRSIYFVSDLKAGDKVTEKDIRRIRPGYGLPPKHFNEIIGMELNQDVKRGDSVQWSYFNK